MKRVVLFVVGLGSLILLGGLVVGLAAACFVGIAGLPAYPSQCLSRVFECRLAGVKPQLNQLRFVTGGRLLYPRQSHQRPADGVFAGSSTDPRHQVAVPRRRARLRGRLAVG